MKKLLYGTIILSILGSSAFLAYYYQQQNPKETDKIWKTDRTLPQDIKLGAYLSGSVARKEQNIAKALKSYDKVLQVDPNNVQLLQEFYILAMYQGKSELIIPYLESIPKHLQNSLFSNYLKMACLFQQNPNETLRLTQHHKQTPSDKLIYPLINSWTYAKIGDKAKAIRSLNSLDKNKYPYLLDYQTFLLGVLFKDQELKEKAFLKLQSQKLPTVGLFPILKQFTSLTRKWNQTELYQRLQELEKINPTDADLVQNLGQTELTPEIGLAEIFYFLSREESSQFTKEECIFLNSIALFLQPKKQLALAWGAELTQSLDFPGIAIDYYEQMPEKSATLYFKEAALLILAGKTQKAQAIMDTLEKTNSTNTSLLTLMAENYLELKQPQKALKIYDRLIPLLEKNPHNKPLANAYISRANLYQIQNNIPAMLSDFRKAQQLQPNNALLKNNIGYYLLENNQLEEGFRLVEEAYKTEPENPYILDSYAYGYYKKKQAKIALPFAEKALDLEPQSALLNMHLGDIYWDLNRKREARFQYTKALNSKLDLTPQLKELLTQKLKSES